MRTATALAALNALALGLILLLYMGQRELADRVASVRRAEPSPAGTADPVLLRRLESLEASLEALRAEMYESPAAAAAAAEWQREDGAPAPVFPAPEAEPETTPEGGAGDGTPAMEVFRRRVRRAIELNQDEDRIARTVEVLDGLVRENKIAPLSPEQKESVAKVLNDARGAVRLIWAEVPDGVTREQRAQLVRAEYGTVREDVRRKLEEVVPPADAQTILDQQLRVPVARRRAAVAPR